MHRRSAQEELAFTRGFMMASGVCTSGIASTVPDDPPDVAIRTPELTIAVEVTRIYVGGTGRPMLREGESNKEWVCRAVRQRLLDCGSIPLFANLVFASDALSKHRRAVVADLISTIVLGLAPTAGQRVSVSWDTYAASGEYGRAWPVELDSIIMYRHSDSRQPQVTCGSAGFQLDDPTHLIQDAINRKRAGLNRYSNRYDERWILIVAEGNAASSFIQPNEYARTHAFSLPFTRGFFYRHSFPTWFELAREAHE